MVDSPLSIVARRSFSLAWLALSMAKSFRFESSGELPFIIMNNKNSPYETRRTSQRHSLIKSDKTGQHTVETWSEDDPYFQIRSEP
jgi:hypothetical protein